MISSQKRLGQTLKGFSLERGYRMKMFQRMCVAVIVFSGLFGGGSTWAAGCDTPGTEFDQLYCVVQNFQQADKDLNTTYQELVKKLDASGKKILQTAQRNWIKHRDTSSAATLNGETVFYMSTATQMTLDRTLFLKARIRECNSTGCVNSKLKE